MKRKTARALSLMAGPLCALALAAPAAAASGPPVLRATPSWAAPDVALPHAAPSALAGFYSTLGGTGYSYNSSGGPVVESQTGTGVYLVDFQGLGAITGGNVEVTSSASTATCTVDNWGPTGADLGVTVDCYAYTGAPANAGFSVTATQPTRTLRGAALSYDWNYKTAKSYTPIGAYQYNSAGQKNHIAHLGAGRYLVTMPKVGGAGGAVKVSAYGPGGGDCQLLKWSGTASGAEKIYIDCYAASGARQNREFDVVYARSTNLMGQNGMVTGYATADKPTSAAYLPHVQYTSRRGAKIAISQYLASHAYLILFSALRATSGNPNGGYGDVQVTAEGANYAHCFMFEQTAGFTPLAVVACFNNSGALTASKFTVQWASN